MTYLFPVLYLSGTVLSSGNAITSNRETSSHDLYHMEGEDDVAKYHTEGYCRRPPDLNKYKGSVLQRSDVEMQSSG